MLKEKKFIKFLSFIILIGSCSILGTVKYFSKKSINDFKNFDQNEIMNEKNNSFCKQPTLKEFPSDFIPFENYKYSRLLIHCFIVIYLLISISIVCDDFFIQSLSRLSSDLNLKEDVAGATFMAAGTSAPELFTSIIGVLFAKSDIGIGTIVGSAIFNVLFIISLCGLVSKSILKIDFYPITRDSVSYAICVLSLVVVLFDGVISWYESVSLLVLYVFYILIMYYNSKLEIWTKEIVKKFKYKNNQINEISLSEINQPRETIDNGNVNIIETEEQEEKFHPFKIPHEFISKLIWFIMFPINFIFYITIPNPNNQLFDKFPLYFLTFIISTIYVGLFTYGVVWMVVIIAFHMNIPDTVAGLTVLAAGTSLPEVVSSIIITRKGKGEMAISNSIGSNVFDILICLGLPWFLEGLVLRPESPIRVHSGGIVYSALVLFGSIILLLVCFIGNRWKLDKKFGILMIIIWIVVSFITCLFEYDFFGNFSLPSC